MSEARTGATVKVAIIYGAWMNIAGVCVTTWRCLAGETGLSYR